MVVRTEPYCSEVGLSLSLPARRGGKPNTQPGIPYVQLDQWPPTEIVRELRRQCLNLPNVKTRESRMAIPGSWVLTLPDSLAGGPPEAFIDGHEFCHLHPPPESGIHLTLSGELRQQVLDTGWGEVHPVARLGCIPETVMMIYSPRDWDELDLVMRLIQGSYDFARGN
jgi:hypothetical protein